MSGDWNRAGGCPGVRVLRALALPQLHSSGDCMIMTIAVMLPYRGLWLIKDEHLDQAGSVFGNITSGMQITKEAKDILVYVALMTQTIKFVETCVIQDTSHGIVKGGGTTCYHCLQPAPHCSLCLNQ